MKSKQIQQIDENMITDLFGVKYTIKDTGVKISTFTPPLLNDESRQSTYLRHATLNANQFRVYLVEPFFLPLQTSLSGLYENLLFKVPYILEEDDTINLIWLFQKRNNWRETAIHMYESYLNGNNDPSDVDVIRKVSDKVLNFVHQFSSPFNQREYSKDVEDKILDDGYSFQCTVEIQSRRVEYLSNLIQDILAQYDYHNGLRLEQQEYQYPYIIQPNNQLLSKNEILSLLCSNSDTIEISETDVANQLKPKTNTWKDKLSLLPTIKKEEVKKDDSIIPRLADSLKRVGITKQARLYNESIKYGARLTIVAADIPKSKNFSDVVKKQKDIQAALGVESLSITQGNAPGTVQYSIPHNQHQIISLRELLERDDFAKYQKKNELAFIVGVDEFNKPIYLSLKELRHLLIVGSQGSGKSVFLNQLITTLFITHTPEQLQAILIDPKQVELAQYEHFPHVQEVVTNMQKAMKSFNGLIKEMEDRYKSFKEKGVKDLNGYNQKVKDKKPYLLCVVEEWADLFSAVGKDAEEVVKRLGQKARAAGIFLVIVTQRPSAKILSGDIKANIQSKFSFNLGNNTNYRTVFDEGIPYKLLGRGDGVFSIENYPKDFQRFQSPIISTNPVEEESVYEGLANSYGDYVTINTADVDEEDDSLLGNLKRLIATTKETRTTVLRDKLSVKATTLTTLMNRLVDEGWLKRHKSKSKGYELVADESVLDEWKE